MNKLALLFPGQGSQYEGMGKDFYNKYVEAAMIFDEACDISGIDIRKMCFESSMENLKKTQNTQLAIFTLSIAMYKVYEKEFGILPTFMAGHSLGEYSALTCANSLTFGDALKLIIKRAEYMQEACAGVNGAMAAVKGVDKAVVEEICNSISEPDSYVYPSNYNSLLQTVISGHTEKLNEALLILNSKGIQAVKLNVGIPTHSRLLTSAKQKLKQEMENIKVNLPCCSVISNVTARPYSSIEEIKNYLPEQIIEPVLWTDIMNVLIKNNITIAVEVGPKTVLKNLLVSTSDKIKACSYDVEGDRNRLRKYLFNDLYRRDKQNFISLCLGLAVSVKNKNYDEQQYNEGVIIPYSKLQRMQTDIEENGYTLKGSDIDTAIKYLTQILETKKLPIDRINQKIKSITDNVLEIA